jgi:hypothetical protein
MMLAESTNMTEMASTELTKSALLARSTSPMTATDFE